MSFSLVSFCPTKRTDLVMGYWSQYCEHIKHMGNGIDKDPLVQPLPKVSSAAFS